MRKPRIAMISTDWSQNEYRKTHNKPGAISQYRLIHPKRYLDEFYDIDYFGSEFADGSENADLGTWFYDKFKKYDMVISKITDNPSAASGIRFITKHLGIPLVVDIDDNIWELKEDQPAYQQYRKGSGLLGTASTYIALADAVFCSTQPLADYIEKRFKETGSEAKVFVLPNSIDPSDYHFLPAGKDPNKVTIGWQGSTTHHEDLKTAMAGISKLMQEYPNVHLELLGGVSEALVPDLFTDVDESVLDRVRIVGGVPAFELFPHHLAQQKWDIGIAPLTDEAFNHSKSHIKWMEYSMYAIPTVASKVYPYFMPIQGTDTIRDGKTGLLAGDWYTQLKKLVDSVEFRREIGENAQKQVFEEWSILQHGPRWKEAIETLLK
jgi:glycosyltransferase involved in cell wall biosynthesis